MNELPGGIDIQKSHWSNTNTIDTIGVHGNVHPLMPSTAIQNYTAMKMFQHTVNLVPHCPTKCGGWIVLKSIPPFFSQFQPICQSAQVNSLKNPTEEMWTSNHPACSSCILWVQILDSVSQDQFSINNRSTLMRSICRNCKDVIPRSMAENLCG